MSAKLILRCISVLRVRARAMGPPLAARFVRRCPRQARASDGGGRKTRAQSGTFLGNAPGRGVEAGLPLAGSPPQQPAGGTFPHAGPSPGAGEVGPGRKAGAPP